MIVEVRKAARFIIIAGLILAVIGGVNMFWGGREVEEPPVYSDNEAIAAGANDSGGVSPEAASEEDFFAEYRLQRERSRSQQMQLLKELSGNEEEGMAAREAASLKMLSILEESEKEMKAENLVKSRGIDECVVIREPAMSTVIIKGSAAAVDEDEIKELVGRILELGDDKVTMVFRGG